jgi:NAD(P)-dependent dehydrogenase (short-subunit alcohol dehydrogenase family)
VNVFGPMRLASAALPVTRGQGGGRIINVTSENDTAPAPLGALMAHNGAALQRAGDPDEVAQAIEQ